MKCFGMTASISTVFAELQCPSGQNTPDKSVFKNRAGSIRLILSCSDMSAVEA